MKDLRFSIMAAPLIALAACSPAETSSDGADKASVPAAAAPTDAEPEPKFALIGGDGMFAMIVDPKSDPASWRAAAKAQCGAREFCQVMGWADASLAATAMPMTDTEVEAQVFQYNINRVTGMDRAVWECGALTKAGIDVCPEAVGD